MKKYFYDIHSHAMNMSHPNFLAFGKQFENMVFNNVDRFLKGNRLTVFLAVNYMLLQFLFLKKFDYKNVISLLQKAGLGNSPDRAKNLLAILENDIGSFFILMEDCICEHVMKDGKIVIGDNSYDKLILTPLIMDFGSKTVSYNEIHYNKKPVNKPVVEQIIDVFNGIRKYREDSRWNLLEIYPFMGINTKNYSLDEIKKMLDIYFGDYKGSYQAIYSNMASFDGDIYSIGSNTYAGIKLYPPLGFDPWPEDSSELSKVKLLYEFCEIKQIPITCHCSDEGFCIMSREEMERLTSPSKWKTVLRNFNSLKLNLAHFGKHDHSPNWQNSIIELIKNYDNVYTDISHRGFDDDFYMGLKESIRNIQDPELQEKLKKRILFGSDFMINLLKIDSYCKYLEIFTNTNHLSSDEKNYFCSFNPEHFLFANEKPNAMPVRDGSNPANIL